MRGRWSRWLGIAFGVLVLLILAPIAYFSIVGVDAFKPRIVAAVAAATGRELTIAGPIGLKLSLLPTLRIDDAALSNPPGFSRPEMARLHRLDLQLALLPLLGRRIEVNSVVLTGPDILLETNAAGLSNWQFQRQSPAHSNAADPKSAPAARTEILVRRIEIDNGQIAIRNAAGVVRAVGIQKLTVAADSIEGPMTLAAAAEISGTALTLKAVGGSLAALTGGGEEKFPIDLTAAAQGATLSLKGVVADIAKMTGADLAFNASVPDLAALSALAGTNLPGLKNITFQSRIAGAPSGITLAGLKLAMPDLDIEGDVAMALAPRPSIRGKLHAGKIDIDALQAGFSRSSVAVPTVAAAPQAAAGRKIFSDAELPLAALLAFDADLNLIIDQCLSGAMALRDIAGHLVLHAGRLRLDPFVVTAPGGVIHLAINLDASANPPPLGLVLRAPSLALQPLLAAMHMPAFAQGQMEVSADLHGAGKSPHAIAAGLNGSLGLAAENARIEPAQLGELLHQKEILQLGGAQLGGLTAMRCLAVRTEARDGVADLKTLLLDTAPLRLTGGGAINLGAETLALRLLTTARLGGTGVVAPVEVGGSLLAPTFGVGKLEALAAAAQVLGQTAVARNNPQFGLTIGQLGLDRLVPGTANPEETCERALAFARGTTPPPAQASPASTSPAPTQKNPKPADILRQLLR